MNNPGILIVEDDKAAAYTFKRKLISNGYAVAGLAHNAQDAIILARNADPALILMDISLNNHMDGVDAMREIQKFSGAPVIYLSACSDKDTIQKAESTRPMAYLIKPVAEDKLCTNIEIALHKDSFNKLIRQSEERYQKIVASSVDGICLADEEGRIIEWNPGMEEITAAGKEEAAGKYIWDLYLAMSAENDRVKQEEIIHQIKYALCGGVLPGGCTYYTCEIINYRRQRRYIQLSAFSIKKERGHMLGAIIRDVTENMGAGEKLKRYNTELEDLNNRKDKFFSIISHDLKSPFQGMLSLTTLMLDKFDKMPSRELKEDLAIIQHSLKKVFNLLENLLQWAKIQTKNVEYHPVPVKLTQVVNDVLSVMTGHLIGKKINAANSVCESIYLFADRVMLVSVIQNLLSNAVKFTNQGGEIRITSENAGKFEKITVFNTGPGIDPKNADRLFRIETRFSTPGTMKERGTGLGLLLCKDLVALHGGEINVKSKLNEGAAFEFTMPLYNERNN